MGPPLIETLYTEPGPSCDVLISPNCLGQTSKATTQSGLY